MDAEIRSLLAIWSVIAIQRETLGATKNIVVFRTIAERDGRHYYNMSTVHTCKTRTQARPPVHMTERCPVSVYEAFKWGVVEKGMKCEYNCG